MNKIRLMLVLLTMPLMAQQSPERDQLTATAAQVTAKSFAGKHTETSQGVSLTHVFEFKFDTAPTYTYTITPCMRGGSCLTPTTASVSANTAVAITGTLADYYNVTATWSGGTVTTLQVNILALPQSAKSSGGGPPTGACGGDLGGTFPNCTVVGIESAAIPASAAYVGTNSSSQLVAAATPALPGPFPYTVIQEGMYQSAINNANVTSYTLTFNQALQASGTTAWLFCSVDGSSTFANPTTGWVIDINQPRTADARLAIMHKPSAGDTSVTMTSASAASFACYLSELSGTRTLDQSSSNGIANNDIIPMPAITPTAGSLVFAMAAIVPTSTSTANPNMSVYPTSKYKGLYVVADVPGGARALIGWISQVTATNVATTPPPIWTLGIPLVGGGGMAYSTFSIK